MAARVKIKKKALKDKGISDMFNQMLGAGIVNMSIAYPNYLNIKSYLTKLLDIMDVLANKSPFMTQYAEFKPAQEEISKFLTESSASLKSLFRLDFSECKLNFNLLPEEQKKDFSDLYAALKKDTLVDTFIVVCDNLIIYKTHLEKESDLSYKFITSMPGSEFCPFPFTSMNLKRIFEVLYVDANPMPGEDTTNSESAKRYMQFFLLILNKVYNLSYNLYRAITKPDIDMDEFAEIIMNNLGEIKKHVPRCSKAFDKIAQSLDLLKKNFPSYYKDYLTSEDSTIIMQNFVIDVAGSTKTDAETTRQFRQIINYYQKVAQNQIKNPQIKMLFAKATENFRALDKHNNIVKVEKEERGGKKVDEDKTEEISSDEEDLAENNNSEDENEEEQLKVIQAANMQKSVEELAAEIEK